MTYAMKAVQQFWLGVRTAVRLSSRPPAEPEAVAAVPRPATSFFAGLTAEQKARALAYDGPEDHGDPAFLHNNIKR